MRQLSVDEVPNYFECFHRIYGAARQYFKDNGGSNYTYPSDFITDLRRYGEISMRELYVAIVGAILLTILRVFLTKFIFLVSILP